MDKANSSGFKVEKKARPGIQRAIVKIEADVVIKESSLSFVPGYHKILDVKVIDKDEEG